MPVVRESEEVMVQIAPLMDHQRKGSYPEWAETLILRLRAQPRAWSAPKR